MYHFLSFRGATFPPLLRALQKDSQGICDTSETPVLTINEQAFFSHF